MTTISTTPRREMLGPSEATEGIAGEYPIGEKLPCKYMYCHVSRDTRKVHISSNKKVVLSGCFFLVNE